MTHSYTCDMCDGTFDAAWTEEEARAEAKENFPTLAPRDEARVCDVCYKKLMDKPTGHLDFSVLHLSKVTPVEGGWDVKPEESHE